MSEETFSGARRAHRHAARVERGIGRGRSGALGLAPALSLSLTLVLAGCAGMQRSEETAEQNADGAAIEAEPKLGEEGERTARKREGPGIVAPASDADPDEPLVHDPYRKTPSGSRKGSPSKRLPPAAFVAPSSAPAPGRRALRLPARLGVLFVEGGRCVRDGRALLKLERLLAKDASLRAVLALPLPRGEPVSLAAVGRLAREAGFDALWVVVRASADASAEAPSDESAEAPADESASLPSAASSAAAGYLVHCQDRERAPLVLATFAPPKPSGGGGDAASAPTSATTEVPLELGAEVLVETVTRANARMRE